MTSYEPSTHDLIWTIIPTRLMTSYEPSFQHVSWPHMNHQHLSHERDASQESSSLTYTPSVPYNCGVRDSLSDMCGLRDSFSNRVFMHLQIPIIVEFVTLSDTFEFVTHSCKLHDAFIFVPWGCVAACCSVLLQCVACATWDWWCACVIMNM